MVYFLAYITWETYFCIKSVKIIEYNILITYIIYIFLQAKIKYKETI